ncbi:GTP-binding protein [Chloroflexota bacterium]
MKMFRTVEPATQEKMDIVFVGHVDHGKSTVIGRVLADTGSLPEGKLEQVQYECERNAKPFEYAYLIDALKDERAQSITIDSARVFFKSPQRHYIIIDAPGHIEFIKNMVTGASRAEAAVLVIAADEGVQENSRRHGYLLWMLGIKQIVVVINKMDLVDYDQQVFEAVRDEYAAFLKEIGIEPLCYIPASGREGDNVVELNGRTPWYQGHTVLSALDSFQKAPPPDNKPFRMPVQDVYKFTKFGDDRRIIAGTIQSGTLKIDDEVIFYPSGKRSTIKRFETFSAPDPAGLTSGNAASFTMGEQIYVHRGELACKADEPRPYVSRKLRGSLFWLGKHPLTPKKEYLLQLGTNRVRAKIETIHRIIDASQLANTDKAVIGHHDVAEVTFVLNHAIAFDDPATCADTGRFVLIDDYEIWGGGIVLDVVADEESTAREGKFDREDRWIRSTINQSQRAERYSQRPTLILVTGNRHSGRKRAASAVEAQLFNDGRKVYYLGVGSIMYGVSADLKKHDHPDDWGEHLRRIAELTHILLDAGLIVVMTAVELTQDDLKIFNAVIGAAQIETVWIGDDITTDLYYDLHIESDFDETNAAARIKGLLQEHGSVFAG